MSKRSDEREHLARLLDAGQISQAIYDERMARMGHRGVAQQARKRESQQARAEEPAKRGRPWPDDHVNKEATIVLRVTHERKAAYTRAASRRASTLVKLICDAVDKDVEYREE